MQVRSFAEELNAQSKLQAHLLTIVGVKDTCSKSPKNTLARKKRIKSVLGAEIKTELTHVSLKHASIMLGLSANGLATGRSSGHILGSPLPPSEKRNKKILYEVADLKEWLSEFKKKHQQEAKQ